MEASEQFLSVHPVLAVKDMLQALDFYVNKLGFKAIFANDRTHPTYAGITRGNVELHLQLHDASEWEHGIDRPMLRFVVLNTEALFEEYKTKEVFHEQTKLRETPWNTKEFAFYDLDKNGLTFYEDIKT
jgi:catechol 2,3-dioxygenase-like lactoylglutathione lyase family enzyme